VWDLATFRLWVSPAALGLIPDEDMLEGILNNLTVRVAVNPNLRPNTKDSTE